MTRYILAGLLTIGTAGVLSIATGCDDTLSKTETVKSTDDATVHKKEEVKEQPDGTIVKEESKTVDKH